MGIAPGSEIEVPCDVTQGAFKNERLVTIKTAIGPITGFIDNHLVKIDDDNAHRGVIRGTVREVRADGLVSVVFSGSFLNTNGLAQFARDDLREAS